MALNFLRNHGILPDKKPQVAPVTSSWKTPDNLRPRRVTYESRHVDIPSDFLRGPSKGPVVINPVPFATSPVPEYQRCYAVTLDNVLSPEECTQLIQLAEKSSIPDPEDGENAGPWKPAMVSYGPGVEAPAPGYRESDRIVWDQQDITNRIWERCCQADGLKEQLAFIEESGEGRPPGRWEFSAINHRMRFLKYSPGHFFGAHTDGPYYAEVDGKEIRTHYTVHLYLNDSALVSPESDLVGGATGFLSRDEKRRLDVNPKAGSVLIFQHRRLYHDGAEVKKGVKFTVRMDILYEWVKNSDKEAKAVAGGATDAHVQGEGDDKVPAQ